MASRETTRADGARVSARTRLLNTADDLFYRRGIRGVGIDEVIREAGVAKVSLYRAFPSKDDLVVAYLEQRHLRFWQDWDDELEGVAKDEAFRVAMVFLCRAIEDPSYRGCPFANFSAEFPSRDHPARVLVERSKRELRTRLSSLLQTHDANGAARTADAVFLLVEGAFSLSQTSEGGAPEASRMLAQSVAALIPEHKTIE